MSKIATLTVSGKSGNKYDFDVYSFNTSFKAIGAVYLITERTKKSDGGGSHSYIYVGETDDLSTRFNSHHKAACFTRQNANCKCIFAEESENKRLSIESDILDNDNFPCNG